MENKKAHGINIQPDDDLIALCKAELPYVTTAFEKLVRHYEPLVYRTCLSYLKSENDAEETTQDVFLRLFFNIEKFDGRSSFKTWLFRIVANICASKYRSLRRIKEQQQAYFEHLELIQHEDPSYHDLERVDGPSDIVGKLVFWLFMLTFLISAAETLGLENVSSTINFFVEYLPNVIAATLISVLGLLLAYFVRTVIETTAEGMGFGYTRVISRLAYFVLIIVVGILAIDQLGIETDLLDYVVGIVLIAVGAAIAIALGLGTRQVANNIVAGVYTRDLYKPGTRIQFSEYGGIVETIGSVTTSIRTRNGSLIHIPNDQLLQNVITETPSD